MNTNNKYIGVFDSGVGGLTVVKHLISAMPNENIIYLADYKHMPYGDKTNEEIIKYVLDDVKFLNTFPLKAIVIACNTADSIASENIKQNYDIPVYGVILDASKKAIEVTKNNKIGVIATTAAINSNEYAKNINNLNKKALVYSKACPFLVPMIEEGKFDIGNEEIRLILKDYLSPLIENDIDTLILGCTHYDLLSNIISDMYPDLNIVSSSRCVVDVLKNQLDKTDCNTIDRQYYVAGDSIKFTNVAKLFMPDIKINQK